MEEKQLFMISDVTSKTYEDLKKEGGNKRGGRRDYHKPVIIIIIIIIHMISMVQVHSASGTHYKVCVK